MKMELLDYLYVLLGIDVSDTPVYVKIMVPIVFLSMAIILPVYAYNVLKSMLMGLRKFVRGWK